MTLARPLDAPPPLDVLLADLVHPASRSPLRLEGGRLVSARGEVAPLVGGVPVFLPSAELSPHQLSELAFSRQYVEGVRAGQNADYAPDRPHLAPRPCWEWAEPWINPGTIGPETRIVCVGGSFADDLPHVESRHKYNVDHLAHAYVQFVPEIARGNARYVSGLAEALPFPDGWADLYYARNSLDHVCNPIVAVQEAWRVLRPGGRLVVAVYQDSTFLSEHESFVVDDEFIERAVRPLFEIVSRRVVEVPPQPVATWRRTGFVQLVAEKRAEGTTAFTPAQVAATASVLHAFHSALFLDQQGRHADAVPHHAAVVAHEPVFASDVDRILYSFLRLAAFTDHLKFAYLGALFRAYGVHPLWLELHAATARELELPADLPVPPGAWARLLDGLGYPGVIESARVLHHLGLAAWRGGAGRAPALALDALLRGAAPPGA